MKKFTIYSALIFLFLVTPKNTYALSASQVQTMIDTTVAPINTAIASLQTAVTNLQNRMTAVEAAITGILSRLTTAETNITSQQVTLSDHSTRIANLENASPDLQPPSSWLSNFSPTTNTLTLSTSKATGNICKWNGVILTQQVQIRGTAHFPGQDLYAVGTCDVISFSNIANYPSTGTNIPVDLYLFWQEKLLHVTLNLIVP